MFKTLAIIAALTFSLLYFSADLAVNAISDAKSDRIEMIDRASGWK